MTKGLNSSDVKIGNRSKILKILRSEKQISRKDLSDQLGLTKSAITGIISELIDEKIIIETGCQETGAIGRNKIMLELNKSFGYVLGLSICETHLTLLLTNILGETIDSYEYEFVDDKVYTTDELIELVIDKSILILWNNGVDKYHVIGLGIGYIGQMESVDIRKIETELHQRLKLEVVSDNNVKALAMSQMDFTNQMSSEDFLFVKYGPGLGMSIVQNGKIIDGYEHRAGEIGHTIVDMNANTSCRCGRKGCLESLISEKGIIKDIEKLGESYKGLIINKKLSIIDYVKVNELIKTGDQAVSGLFEPRYDYFAKALANVIILFNPEYVCVYGAIFNQPVIFDMIKSRVDAYLGANTKSRIKLSSLNPSNDAIGSAALALRHLFYSVGGIQS